MSNLRKLLEKRIEPRTVTVEVEVDGEAESYTLKGMPDNSLLNIQLMEEPKLQLLARQLSDHLKERGTPSEVSSDEVWQILVVERYVEAPEGEPPMSAHELAVLAKERGLLFAKLFAGALQIVGDTDVKQRVGEIEILDTPTTVGLGNSSEGDAPEATSSPSAT